MSTVKGFLRRMQRQAGRVPARRRGDGSCTNFLVINWHSSGQKRLYLFGLLHDYPFVHKWQQAKILTGNKRTKRSKELKKCNTNTREHGI